MSEFGILNLEKLLFLCEEKILNKILQYFYVKPHFFITLVEENKI